MMKMERVAVDREHLLAELTAYYQPQAKVRFGYLFGSYAAARNGPGSDIDIGVYLSDADPESMLKYKIAEIAQLQERFKRTVDLVLINQAPPLLRHEIFKRGILFKDGDRPFLVEYRTASFYQYLDQTYIINRYFEMNKARLLEDN
ncbi:hypothetical protein EDC14_102841 [Hydrogenispora ethanolica]|uniref:Polymerase beta nucleotidyltransferase domain-containing protein n=2 Tax=Hydrogenispora ethanolica TaxID=1082276 RepID=A0A4R1R8T1_HYDET|nr:hypothetical protein EDC14_102841 [Hydrogenispora ethanolica]